MAKKKTKRAKKLARAFKELKKTPPRILAKTAKRKGKKAANRQRIAIAMRKAGIPRKSGSKRKSRR